MFKSNTILFEMKNVDYEKNSLPSPPNSSYEEDDKDVLKVKNNKNVLYLKKAAEEKQLPENYTIDHSTSSVVAVLEGGKATVDQQQQQKVRRMTTSAEEETFNKCSECGKVYKHPHSLSKHQWEHSEAWDFTSKFQLTKHQQVQMLEAAAILIQMTTSDNRIHKRQRKMSIITKKALEEEEDIQIDNIDDD